MNQLVSHMVGDYIVQNHWEANAKVKNWLPAISHAAKYTAAFLPLTRSPVRLAVIGGTHLVLDRYRLAKQVAWAKNQIGVPKSARYPWSEGKENNGFPADVPPWMSIWLMILVDNSIHMTINYLALRK
jgi:hypothetical protein